jgi:hypothetical protein
MAAARREHTSKVLFPSTGANVLPHSVEAAGASVYALFETGIFGLETLKIDGATGSILSRTKVTGVDDNPADETTREWIFDDTRRVFYYLDANFTANGGTRPSTGRPIYLYSVDAETGIGSKLTVQGAVDYPVGQACEGGVLYMATLSYTGSTAVGYNFYSLDPVSARATLLGSTRKGSDESDPAFYSGYFRAISSDLQTFYRLGYKYVTAQDTMGLCSSTVSAAGTTVTWEDHVSTNHHQYMTIDKWEGSSNGTVFVSLAPNMQDAQRNLDIVQWQPGSDDVTTLASLTNAHPPSALSLGDLGYIGSHISKNLYVTLVVQNAALPSLDAWALVIGDLSTKTFQTLPLSPLALAGSMGISGLGVTV